MNHESEHQSNTPQSREPRHERLGDTFVADLADQAPDLDVRMTLLNGYLRYGTPFALYLGLDDIDPYSEGLVQRFKADFVGAYPDRHSLMDRTLETLGLREDLDEFMRTHMKLEGLLTFDYDTFWELLQDRYEIIDLGGMLYVFER